MRRERGWIRTLGCFVIVVRSVPEHTVHAMEAPSDAVLPLFPCKCSDVSRVRNAPDNAGNSFCFDVCLHRALELHCCESCAGVKRG